MTTPTTQIIELTYEPAGMIEAILATLDRTDAREDPREPDYFSESLLTDPREADRINTALCYLEALAAMTAQEIARQQARHRAIEETAYQIQRAVLTVMEAADTTVLHGQRCMLRRRQNPPSVRIEDAALIPAAFLRQPPPPAAVPDKAAIRAAIEAEIFVPGAVLTRGARLERK